VLPQETLEGLRFLASPGGSCPKLHLVGLIAGIKNKFVAGNGTRRGVRRRVFFLLLLFLYSLSLLSGTVLAMMLAIVPDTMLAVFEGQVLQSLCIR